LNGQLTGTLLDGNSIDVNIINFNGSTPLTTTIDTPTEIRFEALHVPEPASFVMLTLGLAAVGGLAWRRAA
jgi:hypothetical protein